ncbi:MAG: hypothetical protein AAFQ81_10610 [Pseudomonadota bacterium]
MKVEAGRVIRVLWLFSSMKEDTIRFHAEPMELGPVSGDIVVKTRRFTRSKERHQRLEAENAVEKQRLETDFSIYVRPDRDVEITLEGWYLTAERLFTALGAVVMLFAFGATVLPALFG